MPIIGGRLTALVGLAVLSTHWPGAVRPLQRDWLLPYLALAVVAWAAAFAVRLWRTAPQQRKTLLLIGAAGVAVLVCPGALIIGGGGGERPGSGTDVDVDRNDVLSFPAVLDRRRVSRDCQTGTGVCTEVLEVWGRSGQPPAEVAVHGDVHPHNVLVDGAHAWLIDWGSCRVGPAMLDLANLVTAGSEGFAVYSRRGSG